MAKKAMSFLLFLLFMCSSAFAQTNSTDYLTITTYYPSPYGVYGTLKLHPREKKVTCQEGEMVYDAPKDTSLPRGLYVCNQTNAWVPVGGGGAEGYWKFTGNNLTVQNTSWNVGIGTDEVYAPLHVKGTAAIVGSAFIGGPPEGEASEVCRISTEKNYFGTHLDALFIEKTDDDHVVEGGMILGFANSTVADDCAPGDPGWAENHVPVMTLRWPSNVGINTTNPQATLHVNGNIRGQLQCRLQIGPWERHDVSHAQCNADEYVISGGGECNAPAERGFLHHNRPDDSMNGWIVNGYAYDWGNDINCRAYAICCKK